MESSATSTVQEIDVRTLKTWLDTGETLLIDVREPAEHAGERIPEAILSPLSTFNATRMPQEPGKKLVLHCAMGMRSAQAGQKLLDVGFTTVYNFRGGLQAWKEAGYRTEPAEHTPTSSPGPTQLQRQRQVTAGALVLLGNVLGVLMSPWFLLLSGIVGVELVYAGASGSCGMAVLLAQLPCNRRV